MEPHDEFEKANERARKNQQAFARALSAYYNPRTGRVVVQLGAKVELSFSPPGVEGLENATPAELSPIEISPSGLGIHFPKLDADIYLPALLEGLLGSKKWMASRMGTAGGKIKSTAKATAARDNGKLGGRPRKSAAKTPARAAAHL